MKSDIRPLRAALMAVLLSAGGCAAGPRAADGDAPDVAAVPPAEELVSDTPVVIGDAYTVGGRRFEPRDVVDFDEVGFAGILPADRIGQATANGEPVRPDWMVAAHPTLPLPSYVEVSRLDTGRTILVRVNDRGPADPSRAIDLSVAAADALGIRDLGSAPVRVRRVNPPEGDRRALRSGRAAADRLPTADSLLVLLRAQLAARTPPSPPAAAPVAAPKPVPAPRTAPRRATPRPAPAPPPAPAATPGSAATAPAAPAATPTATAPTTRAWIVQLGAFTDRDRAAALARRAGGGAAVVPGGPPWRVRTSASDRADADRRAAAYRRAGLSAVVIAPVDR